MSFDLQKAREHFNKHGYYHVDITSVMQGFQEDVIFDTPNSFYGQMPDVEDNVPLEDCFSINDEKLAVLADLERRLSDFFAPEVVKLIFVQWWSSAGNDVGQWHDDKDTLLGFGSDINSNLNIYLDDVPAEGEGIVSFRDISDKENTVVSVKPKRFSAVFLNQTGQFEHRVSVATTRRRLIGFASVL